MNFNWFGAGVWILNLVLMFLLSNIRRIKYKRGAGIAGWISALVGTLILVFYKSPLVSWMSTTIALIMGIFSIIAILLIFLSALSPQNNLRNIRHLIKTVQGIGWFLGYFMGFLVAILT